MRITTTSRFTVSIILVVITTVEERRVVVISLLYSNVTFDDINILIRMRHWIESATTMLVVAFTFALMARERRRSCDSQAVTCDFCLKWSKLVVDRSQCVFTVRVTDSTFMDAAIPYQLPIRHGSHIGTIPGRPIQSPGTLLAD